MLFSLRRRIRKFFWPRRDRRAGVRSVSLHFYQAATETALLQARSTHLRRNATILSLLGAALTAVAGASVLISCGSCDGHRRTVLYIEASIHVAMLIVCLVVALLAKPCFATTVSERVFEKIVTVCVGILSVLVCIGEPTYICRALLYHPQEVLGPDSRARDTSIVLITLMLLVSSHTVLTIRWYTLLPVQATMVLAYVLLVVFADALSGRFVDLALVISISALLSLGRRAEELRERSFFTRLLHEQQLRVETEFRLAQANAPRESQVARAGKDNISVAVSVPETSNTGNAFRNAGQFTGECIEKLISIGMEERWLIQEPELKLRPENVIGVGGFGVVVGGVYNGTPVAVKVSKRAQQGVKEHFRDIANELRILRKVRHPNIVTFHGACLDKQGRDMLMVLELCWGQPMENFIFGVTDGLMPPLLSRCQVLLGICRALVYLHTREPCIVHMDLKPSNILIERRYMSAEEGIAMHPKLLDFGLALLCTKGAEYSGFTPRWAAPELFKESLALRPHASLDVFSFGCLAYFTAACDIPWKSVPDEVVIEKAKVGRMPELRWKDSDPLEKQIRPLATQCMRKKPSGRPDSRDIYNSLTFVCQRLGLNQWTHPTEPNIVCANALETIRAHKRGNHRSNLADVSESDQIESDHDSGRLGISGDLDGGMGIAAGRDWDNSASSKMSLYDNAEVSATYIWSDVHLIRNQAIERETIAKKVANPWANQSRLARPQSNSPSVNRSVNDSDQAINASHSDRSFFSFSQGEEEFAGEHGHSGSGAGAGQGWSQTHLAHFKALLQFVNTWDIPPGRQKCCKPHMLLECANEVLMLAWSASCSTLEGLEQGRGKTLNEPGEPGLVGLKRRGLACPVSLGSAVPNNAFLAHAPTHLGSTAGVTAESANTAPLTAAGAVGQESGSRVAL